jgi:outer membrane protein assembly factor BamB
VLADQVVACGKPFYGHPAYEVYDGTVANRVFIAPKDDQAVVWAADLYVHKVMGFTNFNWQELTRKMANSGNRFQVNWGQIAPSTKPAWTSQFKRAYAMAACQNATLVATDTELVALRSVDGTVLWRQPLPKPPTPWGLAVDGSGRAVVTLTDGKVLCFGRAKGAM